VRAIADTGFIVAFGNRHDRHHEWAVQLATTVTPPFLTCDAVLAEAAFHLGSCSYVLTLVKDGMLQPAFDLARNLNRLSELAKQYQDRDPDLADLCIICLSESYPRHSVVTVDQAGFRIYRRNRRAAIPIVCPPPSR
jgi:predicted nucleic acid-binding protein